MEYRWLRALYAIEFFVAVMAIYQAWAEIGGGSHLDQMDWRWKLGLGLGLAAVVVGATRQAVIGGWGKLAGWMAAALVLVSLMGAVTYYYHVHESDSEQQEEYETQRT
jgi:hypothetical protein